MNIRRATIEDASAIAAVHVASWRSTYRGIVPVEYLASLNALEREAMWREQLARDPSGHCVLVAVDDVGAIVGFAAGGRERTGDAEYDGELFALYLLEQSQRQGVGRLLVHQVVQALVEQGRRAMLVWALGDNPARRFYERLGGQLSRERTISIGGKDLREVGYGWHDLVELLSVTRRPSGR